MAVDGAYVIVNACEEHLNLIFNFVNDHFNTGEPIHQAFKKYGSGLEPIRVEFISKKIIEGLSLLALDHSENVVGFIENTTFSGNIIMRGHEGPMVCQIINMLNTVNSKITPSKNSAKEMEINVVVVHEGWRQKGVGQALLERTIDLARQKGFTQIRATCTGAFSKKLFLNNGFSCVCSIDYKEFQKEGKLDALPLPPHTSITGVVLQI